jgi:hypothetical protein
MDVQPCWATAAAKVRTNKNLNMGRVARSEESFMMDGYIDKQRVCKTARYQRCRDDACFSLKFL